MLIEEYNLDVVSYQYTFAAINVDITRMALNIMRQRD